MTITAAIASARRTGLAAIALACLSASAWPQSGTSRAYGDAARGRADYATYCAPCHGAKGGADGPLADMLTPRPARHDGEVYMDRLSDAYVMRLLKQGGPAMAKSPLMGKWGRRLSEEQLHDVVAHIRSLKR